MYELIVEDRFESAHNLREYKGKCESLHGHNWRVQAFLRGENLTKQGFVMDFKEIKLYLKDIISRLDHTYLNKIPPFKKDNPTSENIARYIFKKLASRLKSKKITLYKISVWESETSCASYFKGAIR